MAQPVEHALRQEDGGHDRGERNGDTGPAVQPMRRQEHVIPVLQAEVDRLE